MKTKQWLAPVLGLSLMVLAAGWLVKDVRADDFGYGRGGMINQLTERFNLDENEVDQAIDDFRAERQTEMQASQEERLDQVVEDGVITEEQKNMLIKKHEEMRQERMQRREEMKTWMEESGIDFGALREYGCGGVMGTGGGKGFGRMKAI